MVKLALQRPDVVGRSLSQWDSAELARQLVRDGVVEAISPQTVRRILLHHKLQPCAIICGCRPRSHGMRRSRHRSGRLWPCMPAPWAWEMVLCVDEKPVCSPGHAKPPPWPHNRANPSGSNTSTRAGSPEPLCRV